MKNKLEKKYSLGIDIGSTTVKLIALDEEGQPRYSVYRRHRARVGDTLLEILGEAKDSLGDAECTVAITGSGGLKLSKNTGITFVQEVVAVAKAVKKEEPLTDVVIELGGEDAKIIYLTGGMEERMNGVCAGGTGSFIDQMAALLQTDAKGLNELAKSHKEIYPIASRCGVFAKTDIQPLINEGASREDLAASVFQAIVNQTISGLACGRRIKGRIAFLGGPLFFLSELREAFIRTLDLKENEVIFPENAHMFAAKGTAYYCCQEKTRSLSEIISALEKEKENTAEMNCLPPLFEDEADYESFCRRQEKYKVKKRKLEDYQGECYLGIDAGSTTFKTVLISKDAELLYSYYGKNQGNPLEESKKAFLEIKERLNPGAYICFACSTGYGESLFKDAYHLDESEVETIAHYYAARFFKPDLDCILDIGGQDMKFMRIDSESISNIVLNEACSSGCGSFISNFAQSLGYTDPEFAKLALKAKHPVDLGTRCTVFMNSNVKQAQKEGADVADISAGLAYSVIKNALYKVIRITDPEEMGKNVVVQGGTFYNDAVLRSFEKTLGCQVIRPDIAGLMGAFGAALIARERCDQKTKVSSMLSIDEILNFQYQTSYSHCKGCQNSCRLTVSHFPDGSRHISGNRCEKMTGKAKKIKDVPNMFEFKRKRLFSYEPLAESEAKETIGIPRVLNMYENYPYWAVFFRELGYRIVLSPSSDRGIFSLGMDSIPSESECYPAKLVHGHIQWLIRQGVKNVFYPCVYYERKEKKSLQNSFNCPMVTSYPENIKNNIDELEEEKIRYIDPFISFANEKILENCLCDCIEKEFHIEKGKIRKAAKKAWEELMRYRNDVREEGKRILDWINEKDRSGIVLAGRPYHLDPEVNHGIPEMIQSLGIAVLTEDAVSDRSIRNIKMRVTNQWMYHARLYAAAEYVSRHSRLDLIQLNSFGCGLDAITTDQVQELLQQSGKLYTLLKIDEVNNLGAARIRVRSLLAALRIRRKKKPVLGKIKDYIRVEYTKEMRKENYTLLCPAMSPIHFDFIDVACRTTGFNIVMLKNESPNIREMGLKYVNNDACYPAMIVTGQILDAVMSGEYDTDKLAVFMIQTGGGCRASNYVGFIRKALEKAGYGNIPVISVNYNGMETNKGVVYTVKMGIKCLQALVYGDIFMKLLLATRPHEKTPGSANALYEKWKKICIDDLAAKAYGNKKFKKNCRDIIREFDELPLVEDKKPKVGIVGEVLVKYMPLANNHLADLLEEEGVEVVIPDFGVFLQYCFTSAFYRKEHLGGSPLVNMIAKIAYSAIEGSRKVMLKALKESKRFAAPDDMDTMRSYAQDILQEGNQCGEGWFLPAEIVDLIKNGANNIVCIQPFGCLPNHIVGKGIIKKVKSLYENANIVAVDYDPSASEANQLNRIKLMLENAREALEI